MSARAVGAVVSHLVGVSAWARPAPLTLAQQLAFRHDTTRSIRPYDEDRTSDALCNTPQTTTRGVAASILLGCTPQCLGATSNSDRSLGADPSTRCRSASVTGLAPSPQRPWDCEKSSDAVRNLRARGLRPSKILSAKCQSVRAIFLVLNEGRRD